MAEVLSEIQRIRRNEQIAAFDKNERAMLEKLGPVPRVDLADHQTSLALFLEWCTNHGVRNCLARPWVISTFLTEHAHRGEEFALNAVNAIAALHDYHGQPNPAATQVVRAALDKIIKPAVPRSWTRAEKEMFSSLPSDIRAAINRRERQREKYLSQTRNEIAEASKQSTRFALEERARGNGLKPNESKTEGTPDGAEPVKGTQRISQPSGASAG